VLVTSQWQSDYRPLINAAREPRYNQAPEGCHRQGAKVLIARKRMSSAGFFEPTVLGRH